jgi:putative tricarboxylic transport membrane protein
MIDGLLIGLNTVLTLHNLLFVAAGCLTGMMIGLLPGLGPISAIALMIPISYNLDPASGMILLAGVYYGAIFGGSTSAILINAPGVAGTVATAFDGFPLAQQGHAGKALAVAAYASFFGGTFGVILLMVLAPTLSSLSLSFQSAEYTLMMVLGLSLVISFSERGQYLKATAMVALGLGLSTVGTDLASGVTRFTFGRMDLIDGVSFLLLAMATFAMAEALLMLQAPTADSDALKVSKRSLALNQEEIKTIAPVISRSSVLGFLVGVLPGAGATIASFLAYSSEKVLSNQPVPAFGEGNLKGLAAPESANNAACTGSFVPLLTLGIPGSGTTAILLGALIAYGIQPGPRLYLDEPTVFWSVVLSMYIGNLILLFLNLPMIPLLAKLLVIPRAVLAPLILFFSMTGVYLVSFNLFDLYLMLGFALAAVALRNYDFPMAPLLLGFILGGLLEDNLRRTLIISQNELSFLLHRPASLILMFLIACAVLIPVLRQFLQIVPRKHQHHE